MLTASKEQLLDRARAWMLKELGKPIDMTPERRDAFHQELGSLAAFIHHLFDEK